MRAIIIQDHDAKALLDQLKLQSYTEPVDWTLALDKLPKNVRDNARQDMHRHFHYIVCEWLQAQGANVT